MIRHTWPCRIGCYVVGSSYQWRHPGRDLILVCHQHTKRSFLSGTDATYTNCSWTGSVRLGPANSHRGQARPTQPQVKCLICMLLLAVGVGTRQDPTVRAKQVLGPCDDLTIHTTYTYMPFGLVVSSVNDKNASLYWATHSWAAMVGGTFVQLGYLAHGRGKWEHQLSYVYNHGFLSWDQEAVVPRTSTMKRTDRCKPTEALSSSQIFLENGTVALSLLFGN
jgi:hypothetical protein